VAPCSENGSSMMARLVSFFIIPSSMIAVSVACVADAAAVESVGRGTLRYRLKSCEHDMAS
jgi:hypothetical protein